MENIDFNSLLMGACDAIEMAKPETKHLYIYCVLIETEYAFLLKQSGKVIEAVPLARYEKRLSEWQLAAKFDSKTQVVAYTELCEKYLEAEFLHDETFIEWTQNAAEIFGNLMITLNADGFQISAAVREIKPVLGVTTDTVEDKIIKKWTTEGSGQTADGKRVTVSKSLFVPFVENEQ